jgi:SAM-dependent methyltransferase
VPYVRGLGLDIGCGPWKVFPHSIGLDGAPIMVPDNRGPNLVMDCTSIEVFADSDVRLHLQLALPRARPRPEAVLKEWWKKIKVGGCLVLYLPHKDFYPNIGQPGANPDHKHDFVPADIVKFMKRLGGWTLLENEERGSEAFDYEYSFFQVYRKRADQQHIDVSKPPNRTKTVALVRSGNFGDALWASSPPRR